MPGEYAIESFLTNSNPGAADQHKALLQCSAMHGRRRAAHTPCKRCAGRPRTVEALLVEGHKPVEADVLVLAQLVLQQEGHRRVDLFVIRWTLGERELNGLTEIGSLWFVQAAGQCGC